MSRSTEKLAERLEDVYRHIDAAQRQGTDISAWEEFWNQLLREYELLCEELEHSA